MAKRSELFAALQANGWIYTHHEDTNLFLEKEHFEAQLWIDKLYIATTFFINSDIRRGEVLEVEYALADIDIKDGMITLPPMPPCS